MTEQSIEWSGVVTVTAVVGEGELHPYDKSLPGKYEYSVEAIDKDDAEEAILDEFHVLTPIKVLDDFYITVTEMKEDQ